MILTLASRLTEGLFAPRRSAQRILSANAGPIDVLSIAALSIVLFVALSRLLELSAGFSVEQRLIDFRLAQLGAFVEQTDDAEAEAAVQQVIETLEEAREAFNPALSGREVLNQLLSGVFGLFATALFAWGAGRLAGGKASFEDVVAVTSWFSLVSVLPSIGLIALVLGGTATSVSFILMIALYLIYVFSAFVAEAHKFRSTFSVLAPVAGLSLLVAAMLAQVSAFAAM